MLCVALYCTYVILCCGVLYCCAVVRWLVLCRLRYLTLPYCNTLPHLEEWWQTTPFTLMWVNATEVHALAHMHQESSHARCGVGVALAGEASLDVRLYHHAVRVPRELLHVVEVAVEPWPLGPRAVDGRAALWELG